MEALKSMLSPFAMHSGGLQDTLKLVVIGGSIETARTASMSAWNTFPLTAHFSSHDYPYDWLMHWLAKQPAWGQSRDFEITTRGTGRLASQIDARKSTFNNVGRDQYITVNNYNYNPSPTVDDSPEEEAGAYTIPENDNNPSIDHELNKYPALVQYAQKVVMTTTTLVTTAVAAVADLLEDISDNVKSGIQSITIQKRSVRYSFF